MEMEMLEREGGSCPNDSLGHAPHTTSTGKTRCALCGSGMVTTNTRTGEV